MGTMESEQRSSYLMFTLGTRALLSGHWVQNRNVRTQEIGAYFSSRIQGLDLVLGQGHRARILTWILNERARSH